MHKIENTFTPKDLGQLIEEAGFKFKIKGNESIEQWLERRKTAMLIIYAKCCDAVIRGLSK